MEDIPTFLWYTIIFSICILYFQTKFCCHNLVVFRLQLPVWCEAACSILCAVAMLQALWHATWYPECVQRTKGWSLWSGKGNSYMYSAFLFVFACVMFCICMQSISSCWFCSGKRCNINNKNDEWILVLAFIWFLSWYRKYWVLDWIKQEGIATGNNGL